jgi:hypothetical protein
MAGLLGTNWDDPQTQGILGAALSMLAASGPRPQRTSVGQIIGEGGLAGMNRYGQARLLQQRDEELARRNRLVDMQIAEAERQSAADQQLTSLLRDPSFLMKQEKVYSASDAGPDMQIQQVPLTAREQAMKFMQTGNPMLARVGLQAMMQPQKATPDFMVVGNSVFRPSTGEFLTPSQSSNTAEEKDTFLRRMEAAGISRDSAEGQRMLRDWLTKESTAPSSEKLSIEIQGQEKSKGRVSENVLRLRDAYTELESAGGSVKTGGNVVDNTRNILMNTLPGQYVGRALGTEAQRARDKIAALRPALINEIRSATGMSARAMDSNVELQFYIKMATDTGVDPEVNFAALDYLDKTYGLGINVNATDTGRQKLNSAKQSSPKPANPIAGQRGLKPGFRDGDYIYLGGDPNNPNSWAKTP